MTLERRSARAVPETEGARAASETEGARAASETEGARAASETPSGHPAYCQGRNLAHRRRHLGRGPGSSGPTGRAATGCRCR
jgi:hypothetical protein